MVRNCPSWRIFVPVAICLLSSLLSKSQGYLLSLHSHMPAISQPLKAARYRAISLSATSSRTLQEDEEESTYVSDAEALLSCWSYLQRRKRLGNWTQQMERRRKMEASAEISFMLGEKEHHLEGAEDEDDDDYGLEEPSPDRSTDTNEIWYGAFTSLSGTEPSPTRSRRSQSAKRTWSDPDFRKRWYQSRWGDEKSHVERKEAKQLESRVRRIPEGFLGSNELASMTEDEIEQAILSYVHSRKLRVLSRSETLERRKPENVNKQTKLTSSPYDDGDPNRLPRDSLFQRDREALKEAQRRRSERAKAAYAKRLDNQKEKSKKSKKKVPRKFLPDRATPQDALFRIQNNLDLGIDPTVEDVEVIMEPLKLAKRRDLLRRILSERFSLRGKCVPVDLGEPDGTKAFATQCSIKDLGDFATHLLQGQDPTKES